MLKRFLIAFVLVLLVAPAGFAGEQSLLARGTVYWASGGGGSDRWTRRHICSTGARLQVGHCAVDPHRIPYGSRVTLPDATLVAVDTGSAVVSRKAARRSGRTAVEKNAIVVDRFFETKQQALNWARRNPYFMLVRVSPPNFRSLTVTNPPHSRQTVVSNPRQQPIAAPSQTSEGPRRSLEQRPTRSSMYAR
ncbi:MAG TPA: 3D domain-containing protein [Chthoniobacterales bacterium]|nr:3D domain-containing protein [Chthoniobacterales bacterium]